MKKMLLTSAVLSILSFFPLHADSGSDSAKKKPFKQKEFQGHYVATISLTAGNSGGTLNVAFAELLQVNVNKNGTGHTQVSSVTILANGHLINQTVEKPPEATFSIILKNEKTGEATITISYINVTSLQRETLTFFCLPVKDPITHRIETIKGIITSTNGVVPSSVSNVTIEMVRQL